ncbi:unnamed protein product [Kuraishia capsulata CBS 1993]|uniref:Sporulation-specific protein SPO7 n=1 Tax=Kuraishia capsulata CBS 1993 TaxID=1382522 RepID=W6MSE5_9ASCO|nr:uncharacterized protein KUCA_T00005622001 [Kuraishia capsulata CBS 1993]CDK29629.1 unnamed protein product [Kuraishia capsulata CBS 1993]
MSDQELEKETVEKDSLRSLSSSPLARPSKPVGTAKDRTPELQTVTSVLSPPFSPRIRGRSHRQPADPEDYALSSDSDVGSFSSIGSSYYQTSRLGIRSEAARRKSDNSVRSGDSVVQTDSDYEAGTPRRSPRGRKETDTPRDRRGKSGGSSSRRRMSSRSRVRDTEMPAEAKILKNLLILEESLRQQAAQQKGLRRKYLGFFMAMAFTLVFCGYRLLVAPELIDSAFLKAVHQVLFLITAVTLLLFYLSGEYHRTVVRPRRFITSTNKGLRQLNVRIVKVRSPTSDILPDLSRWTLRQFAMATRTGIDLVGPTRIPVLRSVTAWLKTFVSTMELRSQPRVGATELKLVLNPRVFNMATREIWELYRNEFWAREGARMRRQLEKSK